VIDCISNNCDYWRSMNWSMNWSIDLLI